MIYLSVIIPVRNEEKLIISTLDALVRQDYPKQRYELLVVDGRSTDQTRKAVKEFIKNHPGSNIRLLDNPGRLSSRGRNIGVQNAMGRLIGVIDGHVYIPDNSLFKNMERIKEDNNALCLSRPAPLDVPGLKEGIPYWIAVARKTWLGHSRSSYIYRENKGFVDPVSSGFAYDKKVFNIVGYFDESFDAAEDVEFHYRLKKVGILAFTSPDFLIYSYPRESFMALFRQQVRYGEGRARFVRKHSEGFTKETPIPAGIFLFFFFAPLTLSSFWWLPLIGFCYATVSCLYLLILLLAGFSETMKKKRFLPGILVAFGIWITHMGLGWGFLKRIFRHGGFKHVCEHRSAAEKDESLT
jgi:glycosyltransferase involved in cell wall biosynthesis